MSHFPDLATCGYFLGAEDLPFVAIGWLEPGHDFAHGEVRAEFFLKLCALLQRPWKPPFGFCGFHPCALCRFSGGTGQSSFGDYRFGGVGHANLFVPCGPTLFVTPSSIAHYIDAHGYCPPAEFQQAVMCCPEMRSGDYLRALLATPAREWLRRLRELGL